MKIEPKIICVDFDGTCTTHPGEEFPKVGYDIGAAGVLRRLKNAGHKLILHTMRSNKKGISPATGKEEEGGIMEAIGWFWTNEIELWCVNKNPDQESWTSSPKPYAHLYIDDAAAGCPVIKDELSPRPYVDWEAMEDWLEENGYLPFKK